MCWYHVTVVSLLLFFTGSDANFSPNITVTSCASQRVVVQLENAAEGGLIFIQGRGLACSQRTVANKKNHEFDFELCNIEYDTKFRVVVQKKPTYQTGHDKVIPVMCIVDTSDLFVSGVVFPEEKLDSGSLNKTARPSVSMRILAPETAGPVTEVALNDQVLLSLTLDEPYLEDFDIKAKNCRAETINLIDNECSPDEELFPNFEKKSKGDMASTFQAFQPTNLDGQPEVDVAFTCSVAVCRGECHKKLCGQIVGWGRKKRDDDDDDEADDDDEDEIYEKVTCATKLKVKTPEQDFIGGVKSELKGKLCAEKVAVASVLAVTILTLIVSWIVCACVTSKLRRFSRMTDEPDKPNVLRRMSEKNINFARSVGRRLSHMLNMPIGYNMRDPKMMHECIPDAEPSPTMNKRRDSVTVSKAIDIDSNTYVNDELLRPSPSVKSVTTDDILQTTASTRSVTLRKRYIDKGVQTESKNSLIPPKKRSAKRSPLNSKKTPFGFITSISIKSGLSKPKIGSLDMSAPNIETLKSSDMVSLAKSGYVNEAMNESVVEYSAEEVPKVRNACRPSLEYYDTDNERKFMDSLANENQENDYAVIREPSLNDGWNEEFVVTSPAYEIRDAGKEYEKQSASFQKDETSDMYEVLVNEVTPDPIEFVERKTFTKQGSITV